LAKARPTEIVLFLSLMLLAYTVWSVWITVSTQSPTIDFFTFWTVPQSLSAHPAIDIYSLEGQHVLAADAATRAQLPSAPDLQRRNTSAVLQLYNGRVDATGSPLFYAVIGMLSSGNYSTDQKRFLFLSLASLILCVLIVSRLLALTPVEVILLLAFLLRLHQPLLADLRMGNVNQLQLLPIALFIFALARSKPLLAGSVIGVATAFKPTTILVLAFGFLVFLIDRDYRQSARMLVGSATAALASILLSGFYFGTSSVWFAFFHSLRNTLNGTAYSLENGNFSLSVLLFGPTSRSSTIVPVVLLSAFLWLLIASRRSNRTTTVSEQDSSRIRFHSAFCVVGGGCAIMLLSSPLAWIHYYVLLLPLSLYVISPACSTGFPGFTENEWLSKVIGVVLRYAPLFVFSLLFNALVGDRPKTICIGLITATFVTLALAAHQLWRQRCPVSLVASKTGTRH
jgi:hypothetical protein